MSFPLPLLLKGKVFRFRLYALLLTPKNETSLILCGHSACGVFFFCTGMDQSSNILPFNIVTGTDTFRGNIRIFQCVLWCNESAVRVNGS